MIDFYIDRGQGPSFDRPIREIGRGEKVAATYLPTSLFLLARDYKDAYYGEIVVYEEKEA